MISCSALARFGTALASAALQWRVEPPARAANLAGVCATSNAGQGRAFDLPSCPCVLAHAARPGLLPAWWPEMSRRRRWMSPPPRRRPWSPRPRRDVVFAAWRARWGPRPNTWRAWRTHTLATPHRRTHTPAPHRIRGTLHRIPQRLTCGA